MIASALGATLGVALAIAFLALVTFLLNRRRRHQLGEAFGRGIVVGRTVARLDDDQFALLIDGTTADVEDTDDAA